jgi:hypothetical protein
VTFWEEGTLSKADLRDIAASRLAGATDRASCLLVDNGINNVREWRGAVAWRFQGGAPSAARLGQLIAGARIK